VREYQVLLAMNPLDRADPHYNLARAYHKMKDRDKMRRHLLLALEAAPNFRPAQKLLLETTAQ
jgi:tetratricopeptide (TPR) repeat protein